MYAKGKSSNVPSDSQARENAAGDQRVGETEGNSRLRGRKRRGESAGLREFAGSLVYIVVVLTSGWNPTDTGLWQLAN
ncbi:hypothetical protein FQN60_017800, partial [Etheostoma spectabile]